MTVTRSVRRSTRSATYGATVGKWGEWIMGSRGMSASADFSAAIAAQARTIVFPPRTFTFTTWTPLAINYPLRVVAHGAIIQGPASGTVRFIDPKKDIFIFGGDWRRWDTVVDFRNGDYDADYAHFVGVVASDVRRFSNAEITTTESGGDLVLGSGTVRNWLYQDCSFTARAVVSGSTVGTTKVACRFTRADFINCTYSGGYRAIYCGNEINGLTGLIPPAADRNVSEWGEVYITNCVVDGIGRLTTGPTNGFDTRYNSKTVIRGGAVRNLNSALSDTEGVYSKAAEIVVDGLELFNATNAAGSGDGSEGAICIKRGAATIRNCEISSDQGNANSGRGIWWSSTESPVIEDITFAGMTEDIVQHSSIVNDEPIVIRRVTSVGSADTLVLQGTFASVAAEDFSVTGSNGATAFRANERSLTTDGVCGPLSIVRAYVRARTFPIQVSRTVSARRLTELNVVDIDAAGSTNLMRVTTSEIDAVSITGGSVSITSDAIVYQTGGSIGSLTISGVSGLADVP